MQLANLTDLTTQEFDPQAQAYLFVWGIAGVPLEGLRFFGLFNYQVLVFCNTASVFHNASTIVYKFKNGTKIKNEKALCWSHCI